MSWLFWAMVSGIDYFDIQGDPNLYDFFRLGKLRYAMWGVCVLLYARTVKAFTWPLALLLAVTLLRWNLDNFPVYGIVNVLAVPIAIFLGYEFHKLGAERVAKLLIFTGTFEALWGLAQVFGLWLPYKIMDPGMQGLALGNMGHATMLGPFLAAALAPALWRGRFACSAIMILAILYTKSSMSYGALAVILFLFTWHKAGAKVALSIAGLVAVPSLAALAIYPNLELWSTTGRIPIWQHALKGIAQRPFMGFGVGGWAGLWMREVNPNMGALSGTVSALIPDHVHSEPLEFVLEYGSLMGVAAIYAIYQYLKSFRLDWWNASFIAIMVNGLANFPLHIMPLGTVAVICWLMHFHGGQHATSSRNRSMDFG